MINKHTLDKQRHQFFLEQNRQDPITGDIIEENDTVVICAVCKSAFLEESWQYIDKKHCHQKKTLKNLPTTKTLSLKVKRALPIPETYKPSQYHSEPSEDSSSYKIVMGIVLFALILYSITFIEGTLSFGKAFLIVGGAFFVGILVLVICISRI